MRRVKILGLCLIAALASTAMLAVGAQAKKPEKGPVKVSSVNLESHLGTTKLTIHSTDAIGAGEFTSGTSGTAFAVFHGVEIEGLKKHCHSPGEASGTVKTNPLSEETGWIKKTGAGSPKIGVDFKPASGELLAELECEGIGAKVKNSVIGETTPINLSVFTSKLNLEAGLAPFRNEPEKFECTGGTAGCLKDTLETQFTGAEIFTGESLQEQKNVTVNACKKIKIKKGKKGITIKCSAAKTPGETNIHVNAAQPEVGRCVEAAGGEFSDSNCNVPAAGGAWKFEAA